MRFIRTCLGIGAALVMCASVAAAEPTLSAEARHRLDHLLQTSMAEGHLVGLTAQVRIDGYPSYTRSLGFADLEQHVRSQPDAYYAIGSITKSITAHCILLLINQGKLRLTTRLKDVLPEYTGAGRDATILELLTHTSGIPDYAGDSAPDRIGDPSRRSYSQAEVLRLFSGQPADFAPGTHWQYSNSGFFLLGVVLERVTGRSYDEAVHQLLFSRLGVTGIEMDYRAPIIANRVRGYTHAADGRVENAPSFDASIAMGAGGYGATVGALTKYFAALFGPDIPVAVRRMATAPRSLADGTPISYRAGALFESSLDGHRIFSHYGSIWGFHANIAYLPGDRVTVGLLTNTDDGTINLGDLNRKVLRIVLGLPAPAVRNLPVPLVKVADYTGDYCMSERLWSKGDVSVSYSSARHTLYLNRPGETESSSRLLYEGGGKFVPADDDEDVVQFSTPPGGPTRITIEQSPEGTLSGTRCRR